MPLCLGLHACYNGRYRGLRYCEVELIPKSRSQFDWGLQLDPMKSESLVIADQQRCGEYVPRALYTPPVKSRKLVTPKAGGLTVLGEPSKVGLAIGTKS